MKHHRTYVTSLVIAVIGAVLVLMTTVSSQAREKLALPWTILSVILVAWLFIVMMADRDLRRGVAKANIDLQDDQTLKFPFSSFLHRTWGLFGSRMGGIWLAWVRLVTMAEFLVSLVFTRHDKPIVLLLSAATFAITICLTVMCVGVRDRELR